MGTQQEEVPQGDEPSPVPTGLPMHKFMELYGTQEKCETAVNSWRWPKGYV